MKKKDEILSMLYKLTVAVSELEDQAHVHVTNDVFPPDGAGTDFPRTGNDPVPRWRALVDEKATWALSVGSPLAAVLAELANVEVERVSGRAAALWPFLARIVAVCEAQVGDGWKADPGPVNDGVSIPQQLTVWMLLRSFLETPYSGMSTPGTNAWQALANRAAAWLRHLLDGAS